MHTGRRAAGVRTSTSFGDPSEAAAHLGCMSLDSFGLRLGRDAWSVGEKARSS